jgi:hypothetical protein
MCATARVTGSEAGTLAEGRRLRHSPGVDYVGLDAGVHHLPCREIDVQLTPSLRLRPSKRHLNFDVLAVACSHGAFGALEERAEIPEQAGSLM